MKQQKTIEDLKSHEGRVIEYFFRGKYRRYKLVYVQLDENKSPDGYCGHLHDFRLNYIDGKIREWRGFWTNKLDRIKRTIEGDFYSEPFSD